MDIRIENLNASESIQHLNTLIWKQNSKRTSIVIILFYFLGAVLFIMGMATFSGYNMTRLPNETVYYSNWHLFESFGVVILLFATYLLRHFLKAKSAFAARGKESVENYLKNGNKIEIQMTQNDLFFRNYQLESKMQWSYFTGYSILADYLLLYTDNQPVSSPVFIEKESMDASDFDHLIHFVKKRIPLKR